MRTLKKGLILVLALALVLGVMAFNVSAFEDDEQNDYLEAVNVMSALGIIEGVGNDNFNPKGTLTRAQAAKIIAYMKQAQDIKATSTFEDTQGHWAESYVAYCNAQGIVVGVGEGKFNPNGTLKGYQFAKMLLCAVGYNDEAEKMTGSDWEIGVAVLLKSSGIADGIADFDGTQPLPRDQACELALRAMELNTRKYTSDVKVVGTDLVVTAGNSYTIGASLLAQYGVSKSTSASYYWYSTEVDELGNEYQQRHTGTGARDDFGAPVTRYSRAKSAKWSKISVVIPDEAVKTYTEGFSSKEITALRKEGVTFSSTVSILLNGVQMLDGEGKKLTPSGLADLGLVGAEINLYTVDAAPGTIDLIVVKQSVLAEVLAVSKSAKVAANNVVQLAVYDNSDATPATVEYKDNDLETTSSMFDYLTADYAKGDFLQMWFEGGVVTAANLLDWDDVTKETAVVSSTKIAASGNTFAGTFSAGGTRTLASTYANYEKKGGKLTIGTEYQLLLDSFGYVLGAVPVSAAPSPWSYAVYLDYHAASASGENAMTGEGATAAHERVMLFLSDGTIKIFDTAFTVDRNGNEVWKIDATGHRVGDLVRYKLNASGKISVLEFSDRNETGLVDETIPEKGTAFKVISSYANSKTVIFIVPNTATASNAARQIKVYTGYNKIPKNVVYHAGNAFDDDYGTAMVLKTGEVVDVPEPVKNYAVLLGAPTISASDEDGVLTYTYDAIVDGEETTVITLSDNGDPGFDTYALGVIETDSNGSSTFTKLSPNGGGKVETVESNFFDDGVARYVNKDTVYYRVTLNNNGAVTGFEKVDALSESTELVKTEIYHVVGDGSKVDKPLSVVFFVEEVK